MDRPLLIPVSPSRQLAWFLWGLLLLSLMAISLCAWSVLWKSVAVLILLTLFVTEYRAVCHSPVQALCHEQGQWQVLRGGCWQTARIDHPRVVTGSWVVLLLQLAATKESVWLVLLPDSSDPESLRRLRRVLLSD